jgi:hypothetical protein
MAMEYADNIMLLANDIQQLMGLFPEFVLVQAAMSSEMLLNPSWLLIPVDDEERIALLRTLTGFTYAIRPDFNCYPRGLVDTVLFDINGNPVP